MCLSLVRFHVSFKSSYSACLLINIQFADKVFSQILHDHHARVLEFLPLPILCRCRRKSVPKIRTLFCLVDIY